MEVKKATSLRCTKTQEKKVKIPFYPTESKGTLQHLKCNIFEKLSVPIHIDNNHKVKYIHLIKSEDNKILEKA